MITVFGDTLFRRLAGACLVFLCVISGFWALFSPIAIAAAPLSPQQQACAGAGGVWKDGKCGDNATNGPSLSKTITNAINILLFIIGAAAVIVIVIQAFRFVNSNGDAAAVSKAKNGIIFALVGLVVASLAYAIVNFILDQF